MSTRLGTKKAAARSPKGQGKTTRAVRGKSGTVRETTAEDGRDQGIARGAGAPPPTQRGKSQRTVVREIRKKVENKLASEVEKAGLGDYIKLVALEKELKANITPREMKVTWVDEPEK